MPSLYDEFKNTKAPKEGEPAKTSLYDEFRTVKETNAKPKPAVTAAANLLASTTPAVAPKPTTFDRIKSWGESAATATYNGLNSFVKEGSALNQLGKTWTEGLKNIASIPSRPLGENIELAKETAKEAGTGFKGLGLGLYDVFKTQAPKAIYTLISAAAENADRITLPIGVTGFQPTIANPAKPLADKVAAWSNDVIAHLEGQQQKRMQELGITADTSISNPRNFGYQLGNGAGSMGLAIGVTMLTKNPYAAAGALGWMQGSETYLGAKDKLREEHPEWTEDEIERRALLLASVDTAGTAALEKLGLDAIFRSYGRGVLHKASMGAITESIQEGTQTVWNNLVAKYGYDKTREIAEGLVDTLIVTAPIGFLGGAGLSFVKEGSTPVDPDVQVVADTIIKTASDTGADKEDLEEAAEVVLDKLRTDVADLREGGPFKRQGEAIGALSEDIGEGLKAEDRETLKKRMVEDAGVPVDDDAMADEAIDNALAMFAADQEEVAETRRALTGKTKEEEDAELEESAAAAMGDEALPDILKDTERVENVPDDIEETLGELSDSQEMQEDWQENHAEEFGKMSQRVDEIAKELKSLKGKENEAKRDQLFKEGTKLEKKMAVMEQGFVDKWRATATDLVEAKKGKRAMDEKVAETVEATEGRKNFGTITAEEVRTTEREDSYDVAPFDEAVEARREIPMSVDLKKADRTPAGFKAKRKEIEKRLKEDVARLKELEEKGTDALSAYDRSSANSKEDLMKTLAQAMSLVQAHISYSNSQLDWLKREEKGENDRPLTKKETALIDGYSRVIGAAFVEYEKVRDDYGLVQERWDVAMPIVQKEFGLTDEQAAFIGKRVIYIGPGTAADTDRMRDVLRPYLDIMQALGTVEGNDTDSGTGVRGDSDPEGGAPDGDQSGERGGPDTERSGRVPRGKRSKRGTGDGERPSEGIGGYQPTADQFAEAGIKIGFAWTGAIPWTKKGETPQEKGDEKQIIGESNGEVEGGGHGYVVMVNEDRENAVDLSDKELANMLVKDGVIFIEHDGTVGRLNDEETVGEQLAEADSDAVRETILEEDVEERREATGTTNEEIQAIVESLTEIDADGRVLIKDGAFLGNDEREKIALYTGAGGQEKKGAEGRGLLDEYYTPPEVVTMVGTILSEHGVFKRRNLGVLEPSAGIGAFLEELPEKANIGALEINETAARVLKLLHPKAGVTARPFENIFITDRGKPVVPSAKYDLVIGNPPYGQHRGRFLGLGEETSIKSYEEYFIKRGLDLLNENGYLAMVVPSSFLRSGEDETKLTIGSRGILVAAYRLPNGAFPTTSIGTDIVVFRKRDPVKDMTEVSLIVSDNYFKEHPDHVLGRATKKKGRRGQMEPYVEGDIDEAFAMFGEDRNGEFAEEEATTEEEIAGIKDELDEAYNEDTYKEVKKTTPKAKERVVKRMEPAYEEGQKVIFNNKEWTIKTVLPMEGDVKYELEPKAERSVPRKSIGEEKPAQTLWTNQAGLDSKGLLPESQKKAKTKKAPEAKDKVEGKKGGAVLDLSKYSTASEEEKELWKFTTATGELAGDFDKEKAFYYRGAYYNEFNYAQGDIYEKLDALNEEADKISLAQFQRQLKVLKAVLPERVMADRMNLSPNARFASELILNENGEEKPLASHFLKWMEALPMQAFGESTRWAVKGYVQNQPVRGGDKLQNEAERRTRRIEGDRLFRLFITENLSDKNRFNVEEAYNRAYNSYHRPDYRNVPLVGKVSATFHGAPLEIKDVQLQGVGFLVNRGVGLLAHDVGIGKTMQTILAINETMARGWSKKPLIVVPSVNVYNQWVSEILELIPGAKINLLANLGGDFKGDLKTLEIEEGTWSITTEEGFKKLGFAKETYDSLTADFLDAIEDPNAGTKSKRAGELEKAQAEVQVGKGMRGTSEDRFFEDLGFDLLAGDEIHNANHIIPRAKMDKEGQVSEFRNFSIRPSIFGIKMWLASQYIQRENGGRNTYFASATPFTNNPLEYYSILSLMARERMRRMGLFNVNDFMTAFMEITTLHEFKADGQYVEKSEVRSFKNYQQFQKLLTEFIDFRDGEEAGVKRPVRAPREYIVGQTEQAAQYKEQAQTLFADTKNAGTLKAIGELRAIAFSPYLSRYYDGAIPTAKQLLDGSPKLRTMVELIKQTLKDNPEGGHLVYSTIGVEFFPLLRQAIVAETGLKEAQVEIISGATPKAKRSGLQADFNAGKIKIILGSDAIQEGVNLQQNTTDLYILSLPWNFTAMRQVIGRAWRQGNRWPGVRVNSLFTENSIDVFLSQKLQNKEKRYAESLAFKGDTLDVGDIDFEEMKLDLITDPVRRTELDFQFRQNELEHEIKRKIADQAYKTRRAAEYVEARRNLEMTRESAKDPSNTWAMNYLKEREKRLADVTEKLSGKGIDVKDLENELATADAEVAAIKEKIEALKAEKTEAVKKAMDERAPDAGLREMDYGEITRERMEDNKTFFAKGPLFDRGYAVLGDTDLMLATRELSTPLIEELSGRSTISRQFILDAVKRASVKKADRAAAMEALAEMPAGETLNVQQFVEKYETKLLPLTTKSLGEEESLRFEGTTLDEEVRGPVYGYDEVIYESPVETKAADKHFRSESDNYFAHVRREDMANGFGEDGQPDEDSGVRRIIEIQSDLFQRGRLSEEVAELSINEQEIQAGNYDVLEDDKGIRFHNLTTEFEERPNPEGNGIIARKLDKPVGRTISKDQFERTQKSIEEKTARNKAVAGLEPYRNAWWERIIREEIRTAALDGKTALQFPTGATILKIEGHGDNVEWYIAPDINDGLAGDADKLTPATMEVGMVVSSERHGDGLTIVEVLGDGRFKAVPGYSIEIRNGTDPKNNFITTFAEATEEQKKSIIENRAETYDISGEGDKQSPIYQFYENDVQRYLRKIRPDLKRVEPDNGVSWFETAIDPLDKVLPVMAFQRTGRQGFKKEASTFAEAKKTLEAYKERFNLEFDVDFAHAIFAGQEGEKGLKARTGARAVTYNNRITLTENVTKTTADHEFVHLVSQNIDAIPAFAGITEQMLLEGVNGGRAYTEAEYEALQEKLAMGFERYVAGIEEKRATVVGKFYQILKDLLTDLMRALNVDMDVVADFYDRLRRAKSDERVELASERAFDIEPEQRIRSGDRILDFGLPAKAAAFDAERHAFFERLAGMEIEDQSMDLTRKDINVLEDITAQARDLYLRDPQEFQAAKDYEKVAQVRRMKKAALDKKWSKLLGPYYLKSLSKNERDRVNAVLVQGDAEGVTYSDDQLRAMNLNGAQVDAYKAVRKAFELAHDMLLSKMAENGVKPEEIEEFMGQREGYIPHKWKYRFVVKTQKDEGKGFKTVSMEDYKSKRAAQEAFDAMTAQNTETNTRFVLDTLDNLEVDFFTEQRLSFENMKSALVQAKTSSDIKDAMIDALRNMVKEKGFGRHYIRRTGIQGYETKEVPTLIANYFAGLDGYLTKMDAAKQYYDVLSTIDARRQSRFYAWMRDSIAYDMGNTKEWERLKAIAFAYYLANDLSFLVTNATQNFTVGTGELSKYMTGADKVIGPELRITKAMSDWWTKNLDADERKAVESLLLLGELGGEMAAEMMGFKNNPLYTELSGAFSKAMYSTTAVVERDVNRVPTFLAARRLFIEQGLTEKEANEKALEVSEDVHFRYGKQHRPRAMRGGLLGNLFVFMHYMRSFLYQLSRDLTQKEFAAFGRKMVYIMALGGATSLPFAGTLITIFRAIFGTDCGRGEEGACEHELEMSAWEVAVQKGLPALSGFDFSGRVGVDIFSVSSIIEDPNDVKSYIGALGALLWVNPGDAAEGGRLQQGAELARQGRADDALGKLLPDMFANPVRAFAGYNWGVRSFAGTPLRDEDGEILKYTAWEAFVRATGFTPTREGLAWDQLSKEFVAQDKASSASTRVRRTIQAQIQRGDYEGARKTQDEALEAGTIGADTDYVRDVGRETFLREAVDAWTTDPSQLKALEKDLVEKTYGPDATDRQKDNVKKDFQVYRTFGFTNDLANGLMDANTNVEKVDILIKARETMDEAEFKAFFAKARKTRTTAAGNETHLLISDELYEAYKEARKKAAADAEI